MKIITDFLMTAALLFVMGYQLWGDAAHEIVGAGLFVLFLIHHILNRNFYDHLFRGKYTPMRILQLILDGLVLIVMVMLMFSGITMSRHVFAFLPVHGGMAMARRLHLLGSYWGLILMSMHLGLHWNQILGGLRKAAGVKKASGIRTVFCSAAGLLISGYGVWVFMKRDFFTCLFLKTEFVFLDYSESPVLFYTDYLAFMVLCILAAHFLAKLCRKLQNKGAAPK